MSLSIVLPLYLSVCLLMYMTDRETDRNMQKMLRPWPDHYIIIYFFWLSLLYQSTSPNCNYCGSEKCSFLCEPGRRGKTYYYVSIQCINFHIFKHRLYHRVSACTLWPELTWSLCDHAVTNPVMSCEKKQKQTGAFPQSPIYINLE